MAALDMSTAAGAGEELPGAGSLDGDHGLVHGACEEGVSGVQV